MADLSSKLLPRPPMPTGKAILAAFDALYRAVPSYRMSFAAISARRLMPSGANSSVTSSVASKA